MPLQTSGAISLQDIQAEFGGPTNPISLFNYYRGGTYVPDTPTNSSIPTSGAISLFNFYGAAALSVNLTDLTEHVAAYDNDSPYSSNSSVTVSFLNDGRIFVQTTAFPTAISIGDPTSYYRTTEWLSTTTQPTSITDDYEIRATLQSGTTPSSGTMNTWLNLGTSRSWEVSASRVSTQGTTHIPSTILIEIRLASSGVVQDSCTLYLSAEATIEF